MADIADLRQTLENLARATWTDIDAGRQLSVPMGETGITDRNMLALRREHPSLVVHKHAAYEEIRTGADWEWWLGTPDGWICLVFQAKVLSAARRYARPPSAGRARWAKGWKPLLHASAITFGNRFPAAETY